MSLRTWVQGRIVHAYPQGLRKAVDATGYAAWTPPQCAAYMANGSKPHRFLIGLDMAFGQWGTATAASQDATISSNTARECFNVYTARTWVLAVGAALEQMDAQHLCNAIVADHCRALLQLNKP